MPANFSDYSEMSIKSLDIRSTKPAAPMLGVPFRPVRQTSSWKWFRRNRLGIDIYSQFRSADWDFGRQRQDDLPVVLYVSG